MRIVVCREPAPGARLQLPLKVCRPPQTRPLYGPRFVFTPRHPIILEVNHGC